jgi:predicted acylesterase/phospholipase RssA
MSISKNNVQYLSLEGGGGAGNAYMGALKALYDLNILQYDPDFTQSNIKGFAGASAGAITSVLLACGYTPHELEAIMKLVDFEDFFDLGDIGEIPFKGGFTNKNLIQINEPVLLKVIRYVIQRLLDPSIVLVLLNDPKTILELYRELKDPSAVITVFSLLIGFVDDAKDLPVKVKQLLISNRDKVALTIYNDWGIFLGKKPRIFIQTLINYAKGRVKILDYSNRIADLIIRLEDEKHLSVEQARQKVINTDLQDLKKLTTDLNDSFLRSLSSRRISSDPNGTTFEDFKKLFRCDLVIMGTNLETTKSHAFSADTTPVFYVEDAVRLSMSLPIVYKPFIYKDKIALNSSTTPPPSSDFLNGVWVDGGYLNNSPLNIFDSSKTIGLRLEQGDEKRTVINTMLDFLSVYPINIGVMGVGESHISQTMSRLKGYNTIILNTKLVDGRQIGLFDFKPPDDVYNAVNINTYNAVKKYFT